MTVERWDPVDFWRGCRRLGALLSRPIQRIKDESRAALVKLAAFS